MRYVADQSARSSLFGTIPIGDNLRFSKGGWKNGPATLPNEISLLTNLSASLLKPAMDLRFLQSVGTRGPS
jgi:hypothetical protein